MAEDQFLKTGDGEGKSWQQWNRQCGKKGKVLCPASIYCHTGNYAGGGEWVRGKVGQSCHLACLEKSLACDPEKQTELDSAEKIAKQFPDVCNASTALPRSYFGVPGISETDKKCRYFSKGFVCEDGAVRIGDNDLIVPSSAGWKATVRDPQIHKDGKWAPICGHGFWENDFGVKAFCQALNFQTGVLLNNGSNAPPLQKDGVQVGVCKDGEKNLAKCTGGNNKFDDRLMYQPANCKVSGQVSGGIGAFVESSGEITSAPEEYTSLGAGTCVDAASAKIYVSGYSWIGSTSGSTSKCREICTKDPECTAYQQSGTQSGVGGTGNCVKHKKTPTKVKDFGDGWGGAVCYAKKRKHPNGGVGFECAGKQAGKLLLRESCAGPKPGTVRVVGSLSWDFDVQSRKLVHEI